MHSYGTVTVASIENEFQLKKMQDEGCILVAKRQKYTKNIMYKD